LASRVRHPLPLVVLGLAAWCAAWGVSALRAQGAGMFRGSTDDPAIAYSTAPVDNVVADLNKKLQDGTANLAFEGRSGYLRSALEALDLQADSQVLVFSPPACSAVRSTRAIRARSSSTTAWCSAGSVAPL
jgi:hypothetical protein